MKKKQRTGEPMTYKQCKYLKSEGRRVTKGRVFQCSFEPTLPTLPMSITKSWAFRWPPIRSFVTKQDCAECPCFEPVE